MADVPFLRMPTTPNVPWRHVRVRLRRLRNEGFTWFLSSVLLFAVAVVLLRFYYARDRALEGAIQREILATVGTSQEPSTTPEVGLVAAALVTINGHHPPRAVVLDDQPCGTSEMCRIITRVENDFRDKVAARLNAADTTALPITPLTFPALQNLRPEAGGSITCSNGVPSGKSSFLVPAQTRGDGRTGPAWEQLQREIEVSAALDEIIQHFKDDYDGVPSFKRLVQAYFISPDSMLRIWTARGTNVCTDFDVYRLWASQSYFTYFWANPAATSYTSEAYIDYGGNGLVQTRCRPIEEPRPAQFQRGRLFGVFCTDLKLDDAYLDQLRRNLFFATALVRYRDSPGARFWKVDTSVPTAEAVTAALQQSDAASAPATPLAESWGDVDRRTQAERDAEETDTAIELQQTLLEPDEAQRAIDRVFEHADFRALGRGPTRVQYGNRENSAFLIPMGAALPALCDNPRATDCRQAVLFLPRNPTLPIALKSLGAFGYFLLGGAFTLGIIGIRLRPRSEELRERLTLLRNLQVGVVQVDQNDWILEANDRAEELFGRRFPKYHVARRSTMVRALRRVAARFHFAPGSTLEVKVGFNGLITHRFREEADPTTGRRYRAIGEEDILALRVSGRASAYYARLNEATGFSPNIPRRWVRVSATPMMLAHPDRIKGAQLANIFATITEVPEAVVAELEVELLREPSSLAHGGGVRVLS